MEGKIALDIFNTQFIFYVSRSSMSDYLFIIVKSKSSRIIVFIRVLALISSSSYKTKSKVRDTLLYIVDFYMIKILD